MAVLVCFYHINALTRNPLSDPKSYIQAYVFMIQLSDNQVHYFLRETAFQSYEIILESLNRENCFTYLMGHLKKYVTCLRQVSQRDFVTLSRQIKVRRWKVIYLNAMQRMKKWGLKMKKNGPIHELPQSSKYPLFLALSLNMIYSRGGLFLNCSGFISMQYHIAGALESLYYFSSDDIFL